MTLLIFDCDGVLVDSEVIALDTLATGLAGIGIDMDRLECRRRFMGKSVTDVLTEIEAMLGRPLPADWGKNGQAELFARFVEELQPVAGVADALARLPYRRCVASSSPPDRIRLSLALTGLAPLFGEKVFSATEVAQGKPAPDLFLYAARQCGAAPQEAIVVEDSPPGIIAAGRAGMPAIGFAGASHADVALAEALAAAGAAQVLTNMAELSQAVERLLAETPARSAAGRGR